ncbi:phosphoribosylamine--glycine ligase [Candidatus Kaiserbacteria bacterium RIFCSPHIGHO2_01_FULL_55_17]|uniref:Phosphoribosylamine--glycine ligase n=1 Tax=Candidatus Kaiserbacteria bacterium RIFCSPHIGHO2_01_FULL_55_17 TaxID=1798484 RepID=A0A1F6D7Q5_9BACT|nr:MAG: phosphoribosylamine--glycine ligase [Candidatus Kaiserbacteria bacterium RIFCSPHIGHO2_01_FULL_55_17]
MAVDVLLVGSGGREHALAWKLKRSPRLGKLYIAPGNGGTRLVGENVAIGVMDFDKLLRFAEEKRIGLTVCSMDDPLAGGIVDYFKRRGLRIWGPTKAAAQIESSKAFAKNLMHEMKIPTAEFQVFTDYERALLYVRQKGAPIVVKASALALGKGVYVCQTLAEAESALKELMVDKILKDAGSEVVIEEYLEGPEVSMHALSDGLNFLMFPPSQDHKRALDGDKGKNTGGMGTITPVPWLSAEASVLVEQEIVRPTLGALAARGTPFTGLLYPGLKVTVGGPRVLEFNARFGDPEAEVYMRLLKTDLLDLLEACVDGALGNQKLEWYAGHAACIMLASGGYPEAYERGFPISGVEDAEKTENVVVFHAGTVFEQGRLLTAGGRVLGVSATGITLKAALEHAYEAIKSISFQGMQYRRDIGAEVLKYYSAVRI